jgi:hypothetical protein
VGEDRVFMQWSDGSFITLTDPDMIKLVQLGGAPVTVEFRAKDEGYITITADMIPDEGEIDWDAAREATAKAAANDDDDLDLEGQLDRLVDKGDFTREEADALDRNEIRDMVLEAFPGWTVPGDAAVNSVLKDDEPEDV